MQFARRVFIAAGVYGLLVVGPMYFLESRLNEQLPPPITHPEYYYGFIGVTLAWQIMYLIIGSHPIKYRTIMLVAIFAKITYGVASFMLYAAGRLALVVLLGGLIDLVWMMLFAIAYAITPSR